MSGDVATYPEHRAPRFVGREWARIWEAYELRQTRFPRLHLARSDEELVRFNAVAAAERYMLDHPRKAR